MTQQVDNIYHKAQDAWRRPQLRRRIKWAAVIILAINIVAWPIAMKFMSDTASTQAATGDVILLWDTANGSVPSGWTCISCSSGQAFYGVFPRGASTYGASTAGADTHTGHTVAYSSATTAANSTPRGSTGTAAVQASHTHTWGSPTLGSGDVRPPFQNLNFIYANNPTTIPANTIAIFDATVPSGWTRYSALDNEYLRGYSDNASGGAATHSHTTTAITSSAGSIGMTDSGSGRTGATMAGTHTIAATSLTANNNAPQYLNVIFGYNSSGGNLAIPDGMIAMFNATPPAGWDTLSDASPWQNSFLVGNSSYGGTGGSNADHNHGGSWGPTSGTSATTNYGSTGTLIGAASHTHTVTYSVSSVSSLPVYRDVIFAKAPTYTITASTSGTQISSAYASTSNNYIGGEFTFVRDGSSANVTQIVIRETGTINANNDLSNVDLYYEAAGTCNYDGTETLFGTAASFVSDSATVTGTMAVGTSQVCVYAVLDIGSGASVGQTIELQITNPSTDVTVSSGLVSPATAVAISGTTTIAALSADVSGTVWTNEAKSTNIGANKTVHLFVNATSKGTDETDTSGAYLFTAVTGISANDSVIVYLDDETENGSTVTIAVNASTNIATLDIITSHISLEHRTAGPITSTDLDDIDGVDATDEDGITVSSPNATFADGYEAYILTGETYTPGGTVTYDDFEAVGTATFSPGANGVTVSGDWTFSATGTLTTSGTVTFDGALDQTIITGGMAFSGATINNTGTTNDDIIISGNLDVNGLFTLTDGQLRLDTNNPNINTAGDVSIGSSASITKGSGTWTFDGSSQTVTDSNSSKQDLGTVTIGPATTTSVSTASSITVTNMTIGANDTLDISSDTMTITGSGTPFVHNAGGTFTVTGSTVAYIGTTATTLTPTTYNNLNVGGTDTTATYTNGTNGITVNGVLTVVASSGTNTLDGSSYWITLNGSGTPFVISATEVFTASTGAIAYFGTTSTNITAATYYDLIIGSTNTTATYTAAGNLSADEITLNASSGTNTFDGSTRTVTLTGTGTPFNLGSDEVFSPSTSTVVYTGSGTATTVTSTPYYNLTLSPSSATTYSLGWHLTSGNEMTGSLNIGANATLDTTSANNYNITLAGNWTNSGSFTANSSTVTLNGAAASTQIITGNTSFYNLYATTTSARTINFASGSTTTVTGTWTATGASGQHISLGRDGGTGTNQWNINPTAWSVNYVTPSNSNNQAASPINPTNYTDGGNNTNWFVTNTAPNNPSSLAQKKTDDTVIATGGWINATSIKFTATVSDTDNPDTLYLCVEKDLLGTTFSGTEDLCGTGVSYSGTPLTATVTITGITDASEYHWQARVKDTAGAYSSWVSYDTNLESERDFGIDTTAPTGATIYDGNDGSQHNYNDYNTGSLTALSAYWVSSAPNFNVAGATTANTYQYSIGTTVGGAEIKTWTYTGTSGTDKYVNATGLVLQTGVKYYFSVRAYDNAGNMATFNSSGQQVYPTLSFSVSSNSVTFDNLSNANNWTNSKTTTITTSTNASSGYTIQAYASDFLRSLAYGSIYIDAFAGTWATPQNWANFCKDDANDCGFGYTSNDTSVQGSNRFASGANYAAYTTSTPGNVVADHTDAVNGTTGAVSNEQFIVTHKVSVNGAQISTAYQALLYIIVTANY